MDNHNKETYIEIPLETAIAAELYAQLPAATQDAIMDLIKSLLSER